MLGCGEVRGDVGKGEGGNVGKCVGAPHPNTFLSHPFSHSSPILSPHANTLPHLPHTLSHTPPHTSSLPTHLSLPPNTLSYTSPHISRHSSSHLPLHPNTLPHSPYALFHTFPHSFDYVAKLPCDDVPLIN